MAIECKTKIAILMATYNGEEYVGEQLDSILNQSFKDWTLYVHDDGSKDDTLGVVKQYANQHPNKIIVVDGPSTGGAKKNFFYLMKEVVADYIMFSDQDDVWLPQKIEKTYEKCLELEGGDLDKPVVAFTDLKVVDQDLKVLSEKMSSYQMLNMDNTEFNKLMIQNVVTGCTMMINHACQDMSLRCKDYDQVIMHDWWCALVASYFGKIGYVDQSLILYRQHGDNSVGAKDVHDTTYIKSKLRLSKEQRQSLQNTQKQVKHFVEVYDVKTAYMMEYGALASKGKFQKIGFLITNHVWKSGLVRNLGLLWFV
jgi:glycosyltransferase involved in cell wall biosynthesis